MHDIIFTHILYLYSIFAPMFIGQRSQACQELMKHLLSNELNISGTCKSLLKLQKWGVPLSEVIPYLSMFNCDDIL